MTYLTHLFCVYIEDPIIVCLAILEHFINGFWKGTIVRFQLCMYQSDPSKGHDGTLEGLIGLQADNLLEIPVDVPVLVTDNSGYGMLIDVIHATTLALNLEQLLEFFPQFLCPFSGPCKERFVPVIGGVVLCDVLSCIDFVICIFTHGVSPFCKFSYTSDTLDLP